MNRWLKKDAQFIWHPYTQMKDCQKNPPILITRAKGIKLYDRQGKFYYDTISSWWCNVHGHNHPHINAAIKKQLNSFEHVLFAGFTHKPAILLAEKLVSLAPEGLTKVFFSDDGSTAVEIALKMSFQYWQNTGKKEKKKFIALDYAYHGDTIGTMSVSGVDLFNKIFSPLLFSFYKIPSPYCYRCPMGKDKNNCDIECIGPLEKLLQEKSAEIAALVLEPRVLASGGMIIYPQEYLIKAAALAKKFNIHLVVDEVATGFGRTGKMFASDIEGVEPDFICLSKGISAGYLPFAATLATEKIYRAFYADFKLKKTFYHGHTYTANPLGCAAALASLEVFKKEDTLQKIQKIIPRLDNFMEGLKEFSFVGDSRSIGLIGAVELVKDKKAKKGFDFKERIGLKIYQAGLKKNIILRPLGSIIYLFLPLCITESEFDDIASRMRAVFKGLRKDGK